MSSSIQRTVENGRTTHQLLVDGEPFIMFGAQVHNSSAWPSRLDAVWPQLTELGVNTAEVPIYWDQVEPAPGQFDFSHVDAIVRGAREHNLRLVLLWFGTWKNGVCDFAPAWVKNDPTTYPLMLDRAGQPVRVLSPHAEATRDADANAFGAFMSHLRELDSTEGTVILVQVQNEPGSLFTDRDYSDLAEAAYKEPVPSDLVAALNLPATNWADAFPNHGGEAFSAFHVARYVNTVAEAGRAEYDLPLSVNVWLKERKGFERPGQEYPSGVPVSHLLDLWKHAAPTIDVIAPDIYVLDYAGYREICATYGRDDTPLLVPETGWSQAFAGYLFYAIGDYAAIGWAPFGVDDPDGGSELREGIEAVRDSFRLLAPAASEIAALQQRGTLRAAVEQELFANQLLKFDDFEVLVEFGRLDYTYGGLRASGTPNQSGRVLVGERAPGEFFVAGFDARVTFRALGTDSDATQFVSVEEGHYDNGAWIVDRHLNGDQTFFGFRISAKGAMIRATVRPL
ncbi:MAG: DUF5597 domain-containing protein [Dehalococcoidia bacterium]|nr:DUF5597 domain-containing protein [Dehalococcoidia bacterium]